VAAAAANTAISIGIEQPPLGVGEYVTVVPPSAAEETPSAAAAAAAAAPVRIYPCIATTCPLSNSS
jgi:hypothetical protein